MFESKLRSKKLLGFTIVNYTPKAVFNVLFVSVIYAGFFAILVEKFAAYNLYSGLIIWLIFSIVIFVITMLFRNKCVRREIKEGMHDPVWGRHIQRLQRQKQQNK
ncbi:hypothetical protein FYR46_19520 [Salmonella enterica]|nr:hypothetical protein [Salmonella enterica]